MARAALLGPLLALLLALLLPAAGARRYEYRKYSEHVRTMEELGRRHPTLIRVETAQKKYGLKAVGSCPGVPHERPWAAGAQFHNGAPNCCFRLFWLALSSSNMRLSWHDDIAPSSRLDIV